MRIAVSGTHCSGKTTLIEEFLYGHPDFACEPEPYTVLAEDYGEEFSSEPCADDFFRQLEFNVERLRCYPSGARVIFERSPVDYLAYILALRDLHLDEVDSLLQTAIGIVPRAIRNLDMIVFLPLDEAEAIEVPDSEDPRLRSAVDSRLGVIFGRDEFGIFNSGCTLVEAIGPAAQRLRIVEAAMESHRPTSIGR